MASAARVHGVASHSDEHLHNRQSSTTLALSPYRNIAPLIGSPDRCQLRGHRRSLNPTGCFTYRPHWFTDLAFCWNAMRIKRRGVCAPSYSTTRSVYVVKRSFDCCLGERITVVEDPSRIKETQGATTNLSYLGYQVGIIPLRGRSDPHDRVTRDTYCR